MNLEQLQSKERGEEMNRYLLTYETENGPTFSWFEHEEEMIEFARKNNVKVLEAIHVIQANEIEV